MGRYPETSVDFDKNAQDAIDNFASTTTNWGIDQSSWGFFPLGDQSQQESSADESYNFMNTGASGNPQGNPPG